MRSYDLPTVIETLRSSVEAPHAEGKRAAVAAILRKGPVDAEILFIKRADREGDPWSGHMAFPGGRHDARDASLIETARRETLEEVGLDLAKAELLTALPPLAAMMRSGPAGLFVSTFVFAIDGAPDLVPNAEVADAVWAPLGPLVRRESPETYALTMGGAIYKLPALNVGGHIVWGLTYRMLELLSERLG